MKKVFWKIAVPEFVELADGDTIEDLGFDVYNLYDMVPLAFVDMSTGRTIIKVDNYHGKPEHQIRGYLQALDDLEVDYEVHKKVCWEEDYKEFVKSGVQNLYTEA